MGTPDWSNKTILVVEDEDINQFFFKSALQITNANVIFASNGREGINEALTNMNIDCILMDIRLPEVNGYEATQSIKAVRADLPIIVQTAYALNNERLLAWEAGCDEYITKPVKISVLYEVLSRYLGR